MRRSFDHLEFLNQTCHVRFSFAKFYFLSEGSRGRGPYGECECLHVRFGFESTA